MDVLKILRSIEELLYEALSWLIFYPRTLWKVLTHPLRTMKYSDQQQTLPAEQRYGDTLSPPFFLVLSILIAHGFELLAHLHAPSIGRALAQSAFQSEEMLLVFRALLHSVHPMLYAAAFLWLAGRKLDRDRLREPFFAQCYLSGATAILVSLGFIGIRYPSDAATAAGMVLIVGTTAWYLNIQRLWFMHVEGFGKWKAFAVSLGAFLAASAIMVVAAGVGLL